MPQTNYILYGREKSVSLRGDSARVLEAARLAIMNVTATNPARAEFRHEIQKIELSLADSRDLELHVEDWGCLKDVLFRLFDQGEAELIVDGRTYSHEAVVKEYWRVAGPPGFSRGGRRGFLYRDHEGNVVYKQGTKMS